MLATAGIDRPLRFHGVPGGRIERLGVEDRHALLGGVQRVMRLEPGALGEALKAAGITRQGLLGDRRRLPEALENALPAMPDRPVTNRQRPRRRPQRAAPPARGPSR